MSRRLEVYVCVIFCSLYMVNAFIHQPPLRNDRKRKYFASRVGESVAVALTSRLGGYNDSWLMSYQTTERGSNGTWQHSSSTSGASPSRREDNALIFYSLPFMFYQKPLVCCCRAKSATLSLDVRFRYSRLGFASSFRQMQYSWPVLGPQTSLRLQTLWRQLLHLGKT